MKPRQLEVFHAIMSAPSLTEAARGLGVSQPAVSATLKQMEDELGLLLFDRVGGRLVPTQEADLLFPEVERVFLRLQALRRIMKGIREGSSGFLSVIAVPTLADTVVPRAFTTMQRRCPGMRLRLEIGSGRQIADAVVRREFDLGLVYGPNAHPEVGAEVIGHTTVGCAMRADHKLAGRAALTPRDLEDQSVTTFPPGAPIRTRLEEAFSAASAELVTAGEVTYSFTACLLAMEGAGIALVDPLIVATRAFPGLVIRPLTPPLAVELLLLYPKSRPRSRLMHEVIVEMRKTLADLLKHGGMV